MSFETHPNAKPDPLAVSSDDTNIMAHCITAIILKGGFDKDKAREFDLRSVSLGLGLSLFHIDHYYSACWQHKLGTTGLLELSNVDCGIFPNEMSISEIIKNISVSESPEYAIIMTDYFGGVGSQYANVFIGSVNADKNVSKINQALHHLGVRRSSGLDEFDTVGLGEIRRQPRDLDKYIELANEFGV